MWAQPSGTCVLQAPHSKLGCRWKQDNRIHNYCIGANAYALVIRLLGDVNSNQNSRGLACHLYVQTVYADPRISKDEIRLDRESDEVQLSAGDWLTTNCPDDT